MMRINFDEVYERYSKTVSCPDCGKKVRRTKKFWQTVSPFNKNADGGVKTRSEIYAELKAEAAEWQRQPEKCSSCVS